MPAASVTPGDCSTIEASVVHEGSGFAMTEAKISVDGGEADLVQRRRFTLLSTIIPFPNPDDLPPDTGLVADGQAHRRAEAGHAPVMNRTGDALPETSGRAEVWITGIDLAHLPLSRRRLMRIGMRLRANAAQVNVDARALRLPYINSSAGRRSASTRRSEKGRSAPDGSTCAAHIGTYAAGLAPAVDSAGVKGNHGESSARMDMMLFADTAAALSDDIAVESGHHERRAAKGELFARLSQRALADERSFAADALFLAQLSNLLAGNVSPSVHGVSGSSRTFMGEEAAKASTRRGSRWRGSPKPAQSDICVDRRCA